MDTQDKIIIKTYPGNQNEATYLYKADSIKMAQKGYSPISQTWTQGRWSGGDFLIALLLCFILIGILIFVYMLVVTPKGALSVTYELQAKPDEEKTCPKCAEKVKSAAVICRFCRHEFGPAEKKEETSEKTEIPTSNITPANEPSQPPTSTIGFLLFFVVCALMICVMYLTDKSH